ncbi:TonB-dependent receptor domain-containing protein [Mucilaginibacter sp. Mucisp86]|uniref:TonB-dependent receptor n=1 Tax=Mucilaginibacter sp. Mucisp86 TaxID=3243060 RepID=UPI0039B5798A
MKKTLTHKRVWCKLAKKVLVQAAFAILCCLPAFAQQQVKGTVTDEKGNPLPGVTIHVKDGKSSASTDSKGEFTISVPSPSSVLMFSMVGYKTAEQTVKAGSSVTIRLTDNVSELQQIIVTGVFDSRKRLDASIAISTISAQQIKIQTPQSAADLLKNVPGVYVNSSAGEIRNQVAVRGTPTSNDVSIGYFYVSMQEDGLPVTNFTGANYGPDYFLRADATTARVEAVRGGSASITGSDAPGGLFNYTSKMGGAKFAGEAIVKYGLEGNSNPYYRADLNIGGPLNKTGDLTYDIGGFYRYSDGARYAGYPLNKGGQLKFNMVKKFGTGRIKLYGKFLDDKNGYFDFLPFTGYINPQPAADFSNNVTLAGPASQTLDFKYTPDGKVNHFQPSNLIHNLDRAIGLEYQQSLGNNWSITNNFKYSNKEATWNAAAPLGILSADGILFYGLQGLAGKFGTYNFTDLTTGQKMLTVVQSPNLSPTGQFLGINFTKTYNQLPNGQVQSAPVLFELANALHNKVKEVMEQFSVRKVVGKTTFNAGVYVGHSNISFVKGYAGQSFTTLEDKPHPLGLTYTNFSGAVTKVTDANGFTAYGSGYGSSAITNNRFDAFFGQSSPLTDRLTLDYGFRYNYNQFTGSSNNAVIDANATAAGGYDNNLLTYYDNNVYVSNTPFNINKTVKSLSYSAALNYKFSEEQAIYVRYSEGRKAPDLQSVTAVSSQAQADAVSFIPIHVVQAELGYKVQKGGFTGYFTPFYSDISNKPTFDYTQDVQVNTYYYTKAVFSEQRTIGVEMESVFNIGNHINVRGAVTLQHATSVVERHWNVGKPGPDDDQVVETRGGKVGLTPAVLTSITPSYRLNKFMTSLGWRYVGSSAANAANAFTLPGYSTFNYQAGYQLSSRLYANLNINNVFNSIGVTGWYAPGGFPGNLSPEALTKAQVAANPNATYGARPTQPRSYFLSLSYNFN